MANNTINSIMIKISNSETVQFEYSNGKWSRSITTTEISDGTKEVSTSSAACSAEDVIVALLLNMGQEGVLISAGKNPYGTPILAQSWLPRDVYCLNSNGDDRYQPYLYSDVSFNTLARLVEKSGVGIEIA